ncbi:MAG: methyltransferase regulatory domain-containing protein [Myxococcota bacterium]
MTVETYERVPYSSRPFAYASAERLAVIGALFEVGVVPPSRARVLEIGCAGGGNLIPRAAEHPGGTFLGIDPAESHVREAQSIAFALGLTNVEVQKRGLEDLTAADGPFDYIICHGVYSWIPEALRAKLLAVCSELLADNGIAYISYNTLPGWNMRRTIREAMQFHIEPFSEPAEQIEQARAMVQFLVQAAPGEGGPWHQLLDETREQMQDWDDHYLFHEHLAPTNDAVYVRDFIANAEGAGLEYLGEAEISDMMTVGLPPEVRQQIDRVSVDATHRQQYLDFLLNRAFRRSLLVKQGTAREKVLRWPALKPLYVASRLSAQGASVSLDEGVMVEFTHTSGASLETSSAILKAAWSVLQSEFPRPLSFSTWVQRVAAMVEPTSQDLESYLGENLLFAYAQGLAELWPEAIELDGAEDARPKAFGFARLQAAAKAKWAVTRRHDCYNLDALDHHVMILCDGTRTRDAMVGILAELARTDVVSIRHNDDSPVTDAELETVVRELLEQRLLVLGQLGLLQAAGSL